MDLALALELYRTFDDDLRGVIEQQRTFLADQRGRVVPQLDDVEAELTYLALRAERPATVMELGTYYGWSTTWILSALRDNGVGRLHSFDRVDHAVRTVPTDLAAERWTFVAGDITATLPAVPDDVGYLFVDADHGRRFARWYLAHLFPRIAPDTPVSVHDVFHGPRARPWSEGGEVLRWLAAHDTPWFTAARWYAKANLAAIDAVRAERGLTGARGTSRNPMIFFRRPV